MTASTRCAANATRDGVTWRCTRIAEHDGKCRYAVVLVCANAGCTRPAASEGLCGRHVFRGHYEGRPEGRSTVRGSSRTGLQYISRLPATWRADAGAFLGWLDARGLAEQTKGLRMYHLSRIASWTGGRPPMTLTVDDLAACLNRAGWAPATKASTLASLKVFYGWAVSTDRIDKSPAERIPKVKVPQRKPKPVLEDVFALVLATAPTLEERTMLRLAGVVGLRRAEVAQVHYDDIVQTPIGWVLEVRGKGDKDRVVPLPPDLAADLATLTEHGGYAFPGPTSGHLSPHWVGTMISRLLPDGYTMHKLRHRALTQAYQTTKDIVLTARLAGHASVATTQAFYVAVDEDALRSMVEGIAS